MYQSNACLSCCSLLW